MIDNLKFGQSQTLKVFENDLIKLEKAQKALLCDISNKLGTSDSPIVNDQVGVDCTGNSVSVSNAILTVPSPNTVQKVQICGNSSTNNYNINEFFVLSDIATMTLAANTYHSVSYVILSGTANITIGGVTLASAPAGYSGEDKATTLLVNSIIISTLSTGSKVAIKTIK